MIIVGDIKKEEVFDRGKDARIFREALKKRVHNSVSHERRDENKLDDFISEICIYNKKAKIGKLECDVMGLENVNMLKYQKIGMIEMD